MNFLFPSALGMEFVIGSNLFENIGIKLKVLGKGGEKDVQKLSDTVEAVHAVLFDADKVQFVDDSVRQWVDKLQEFCSEADGLLDELQTSILKSKIGKGEFGLSPNKVCFCIPSSFFRFSPFGRLRLRYGIGRKIIELNKKLDKIALMKESYTTGRRRRAVVGERRIATFSVASPDELHGQDSNKKDLVSKLLTGREKGLEIIPIVGMWGIGKTTLAQFAYHHEEVKNHFQKRIWVCVSDPFDLIKVLKAIIEAVSGNTPELFELESLLTRLTECIQGKKFLLVLDDVWTEDSTNWETLVVSLQCGAGGSRVLVTTRKEEVAIMMRAKNHMITLEKLSEEDCRVIFKELAFSEKDQDERQQLEEIGNEIVEKCKGIPLVAKTLGILMRAKHNKEEWEDVLGHQLWELSDVRHTIFASLLLSYYDLLPLEKRCLLYCSVFPKDFGIAKNDLIELWMSQGYLDGDENLERGENCFKSLEKRSFFQNDDNSFIDKSRQCKVHDIVHAFVQFVTRKMYIIWEVSGSDERTNQEDQSAHHCTLVLKSGAQIPISVYQKNKLRTLFVKPIETSTPLNLDLLSNLSCLWTLYLQGCGIEKLPGSIDKLMHLRYLNLSDNSNLKELPYKLCNLLNLQTLRLNNCSELRSLPERMEKLINLQHLYIDGSGSLKELPKGIGRLASLRILDAFIVPCNYLKNKKAMNLEDLNKLEDFGGSFSIRDIGNVEDACHAEKVELRNKQNLVDLKLKFSQCTGPQRTEYEWEVLLEVLQPPLRLESLQISKYHGARFPYWMGLLVNLRKLELKGCPNCEYLPSFGRLPSLEMLHIEDLDKVKVVGLEFLGVETGSDTREIETGSESFPQLKNLRFQGLHSWMQWLGIGYSDSRLTIMPRLESVNISDCERLETLPDFIQVSKQKFLKISNCPQLRLQ